MAKALELSYANLEVEQNHITELKLFDHPTQTEFPDFKINGTQTILYCIECSITLLQQNSDATVSFRHERNCGFSEVLCQSGSINHHTSSRNAF
jgi:cysteine desulfurase